MNPIPNENKVDKSFRNSEKFAQTLQRAMDGDYDVELNEAREAGELIGTNNRLPLLKVTEIFTIRVKFSLEQGADFYQLYKEKFYIQNPGSNYFETVKDEIYRSVVAQKETGDKAWADAVSARLGIAIESTEEAAEEAEA